ncbi:MAG: hypothetical protein AB1324_04830 [Candidatus Micrarchaeota archaeon]
MPSRIHSSHAPFPPKKGVDAQVLVDGFSPAPARDSFSMAGDFALVASYLLEGGRGFRGLSIATRDPLVLLWSEPETVSHYRLSFGLTLLLDSLELQGRMGIKVLAAGRSAGRFVHPEDQMSCIKFLEVLEGVDSLGVKFRYRDSRSSSLVSGELSL